MNVGAKRTLERRNFRLSNSGTLTSHRAWFENSRFLSNFLNVYTLLVPAGEQFVIRTCRRYAGGLPPSLADELKRLFFQEGSHSREHRKVVAAMERDGLALPRYQRFVDWVAYALLEPLTPLPLRLATACAIEHHNASIATWFLQRALLHGATVPELRRLLLWHFAEEIEHKETVFNVFVSTGGQRYLRVAGALVSVCTFLSFLLIGVFIATLSRSARGPVISWRQELQQVAHQGGLVRTLVRASVEFCQGQFRPDPNVSAPLLDAALKELRRLGDKDVSYTDRSAATCLPPAFQARLRPFQERLGFVKSRHQYFFSRIERQAGAKVEVDGRTFVNFATYSYLGLTDHTDIAKAARDGLDRYGTGTQGVRLLGGNLTIHEALETTIARFFNRESAITFSSGFMTNVSVIATMVGAGGHVLSDERNHASIIDGCRLSGAHVTTFRHNDPSHLDRSLASLPRDACKLVVVDAVYSMDGDVAPLPALIEIRDRHPNTLLMVDEAHSLGVLGSGGRGIEAHFGCEGEVDLLMGTLSKTIPAQGGYIAAGGDLVDFLRYNARGFMFSAPLSPVSSAAAIAAFGVIDAHGEALRQRLMANVQYFIDALAKAGFDTGMTQTAIVPILLGDEALAFEMARYCHANGVFAMPVAFPAVARGAERLRMNVTAVHQRADIDYAVRILAEARLALTPKIPSDAGYQRSASA